MVRFLSTLVVEGGHQPVVYNIDAVSSLLHLEWSGTGLEVCDIYSVYF